MYKRLMAPRRSAAKAAVSRPGSCSACQSAGSVAHQRTSAVRSKRLRTMSCTSVCARSVRRTPSISSTSESAMARLRPMRPSTLLSNLPVMSVAICASRCTSLATTAKPFPVSPALAASISALIASSLICLTIWVLSALKRSRSVLMPSVTTRMDRGVAFCDWAMVSALSGFIKYDPGRSGQLFMW